MKTILFAGFTFLFALQSLGQEHVQPERCGTDAIHQQNMQNPEYAAQFLQKKMAVRDYLFDRMDQERMDCDEIIFIPVAVHYQLGPNGTIPLDCAIELALDQVRILNEDFAGTNPDIDRWEELQPAVWPAINNKESCIQFCLATLDHPASSGLATGDFAVTINQVTGQNNPQWAGYMNMYVRDMTNPLGFSPLGGTGNGDGIVVGITYFGSFACPGWTISPQYGLGRTVTHEVGHYLNLEHPFGNNCDNDNDGIADTPITSPATFGCPYVAGNPAANSVVSCTAPKLWPSYMDYCDDACLFMFSAGQIDVMEAYVNTSLVNLQNSATIKCQDALCVGFRANIAKVDETCSGNDGSINITIEGGVEPYSFSANGGVSFQNNGSFSNLVENTYSIVVRDGNECEILREVVLSREKPPLRLIEVTNAFCGDNSGTVLVEVNHPDVFEYSISGAPGWRDVPLFTGLFPGTYTVNVRNAAECLNNITVVVGDNTDLQFSPRQIRPVNCPLIDNGIIWVDVNGVPPYQFTLNDEKPRSSGRYDNLSQGNYTIRVLDSRGCRLSANYTIGVSFLEIADDCPCEVFVPNAITANADGLNDRLVVVPSCPISDYQLQIFDRWGGVVFETNDYEELWNGGQNGYYVQNDIYFYRITYRWGEARNESLEVQMKTGYVQVLR